MKFLYIIIFFLFSFHLSFGQNSNIDALIESEKIRIDELDSFYYEIFREKLGNKEYDKAIEFLDKTYYAAIANGNPVFEERALYAKGYTYFLLNDYERSVNFYRQARDIAIENKYYTRLLHIYTDLGETFLKIYEYNLAVESYLELLKYSEITNNVRHTIHAYHQLGLIDLRLGNFEEALKNFNSALDLRMENNLFDKVYTNKYNIAICNNNLLKFNKAIDILFEILKDYDEGRCDTIECDKHLISGVYLEIGSAYLSLNEFNESKKYLSTSIKIIKDDEINNAKAYGYLADLYMKEDNYDSSIYYLGKSLELAVANNDVKNVITNKLQFARIYEKSGNYEKAYKMSYEANQLKDSIYSADLSQKIRDAYVNLANYKSNQVINRQDQTIKRSYNFLFMLGIILILISIVLALTYRALTYRRRINKRLDEMVKQKTIELVNTNDELIHSRKELDSFLYRTSHDIRGPIATLMGLTKLARLEAQDHLMQSYLEKIELTGNKLNAVISRLTNVSQINSQPLDICDINVYQVINEVIDELKLHRNDVAFKLTGDTSSKIKTDKILLKIILENLLDNSFKFYDEKEKDPFVELNIQQNGNLEFTITDNGVGIDPEYRERVFELFFVANEKDRGTGIGLYQTQLAIKKLQGDVVLALNKKPTSFKVVIPANGVEKNEVEVA